MNKPRPTNSWDFEPLHELLDPVVDDQEISPTFEASLNAHGKYETMRFVLRLSPRNHELINSLESRIYSVSEISNEELQAYSTYIHETIHWWQHVGSTSGLLLSLSYLGQTHASLNELHEVIKRFGLKKPLKRWTDEVLTREGASAQLRLATANIAVNNALDVEYYKRYALDPKAAVRQLVEQKHFESIGHGYHIAYGHLLSMLSSAVDPDFLYLPKAPNWEQEFIRLSQNEHEGFYYGSPIHVSPIGLRAIYEGQARFIQLQFLSAARAETPSCQDWRHDGYLSGIYVEAFEMFLRFSESTWPENIDDPLMGLFLLICDLAINPTRGFPLEIESFEDFILDVDVGIRFFRLSKAVADLPHLKTAIRSYSRDEYIEVSEQLITATGYDHPLAALDVISHWMGQSEGVARLMLEHKTFEFDQTNLPVRVFFSHFVSFARDKYIRPEFFCWPGAWMVGAGADAEITELWLRHLSLFTDRGDKAGVYPRKWPGRDEKVVKKMFDNFYGTMALYDLTRQWILLDGPFTYDYSWLTEKYSQQDVEAWARDTFKKVYGINLSDFEIVA